METPLEFDGWLFVAVVAANFLCMAIMAVAQELDHLPPRHSVIPGTNQRFIYMQDFWSMIYGDIIAIPLIANAFMHVAAAGLVSDTEWLVLLVIATVDASGFYLLCVHPNHKPDQGYPEPGKIGWNGIAHLPYHGVGMAMSLLAIFHIFHIDGVISVLHIFSGDLNGWPLYVGLVGGVIYVAFFILDIRAGNFASLKKTDR